MATHIRNQLKHHDPEFVKKIMPAFRVLKHYFRYEAHDVDRIPTNKASMVVMNHGVIPYHGFLLTLACVEQLGLYPRGLGAGFLFDLPLVREFFLKGGAVNANPKNAKKLLESGHCVMVAPGGIYEALIANSELDRIPWERRTGFVRTAVRAKVPIIPTYGEGIDKAYYNSRFLLKKRIKILEKTRFSLPLIAGIGLLPLPVKLDHYVGKAISTKKRAKETEAQTVKRVHRTVLKEMSRLKNQATT